MADLQTLHQLFEDELRRRRCHERDEQASVAPAMTTANGASMNRDEVKGKAEVLKGKIKQATGDLTDDPALHDEGIADEAAGKTRDTFGHAKRKVGEAAEHIGKTVKK